MDIIVRGNPNQIDFVRAVCREKCRRGDLQLLLPAPSGDNDKKMAEMKHQLDEAKAENASLRARVAELENAPARSGDVVGMDDKTPDDEDMKFVDLDADDKTITNEDGKGLPQADSKKPARKSPKSGKTE